MYPNRNFAIFCLCFLVPHDSDEGVSSGGMHGDTFRQRAWNRLENTVFRAETEGGHGAMHGGVLMWSCYICVLMYIYIYRYRYIHTFMSSYVEKDDETEVGFI